MVSQPFKVLFSLLLAALQLQIVFSKVGNCHCLLHSQLRFKQNLNDHLATDYSKPKLLIRKPSVTKRKAIRKTAKWKSPHKQIFISYARKEASGHALKLREALTKLGFTSYLDIQDNELGKDWLEQLNDAVLNCDYFVAIITPLYGETTWTNREYKVASAFNKIIIPINFLDTWPPESLAIHLATTNFIQWRLRPVAASNSSSC